MIGFGERQFFFFCTAKISQISSWFEGVCSELPSSWPPARVFRGRAPRSVAVPAVPENCVLEDPYRSCAFGRFEKSKPFYFFWVFCEMWWKLLYCHSEIFKFGKKRCTVVQNHSKSMKICVLSFKIMLFVKINENRYTAVQNHWKSMNFVALSFKIIQNRWNSLYYRSKSVKIVVLSFKIMCFLKIVKNRCTIVQNRSKPMKIVVLSFKIV